MFVTILVTLYYDNFVTVPISSQNIHNQLDKGSTVTKSPYLCSVIPNKMQRTRTDSFGKILLFHKLLL